MHAHILAAAASAPVVPNSVGEPIALAFMALVVIGVARLFSRATANSR